MSEKIISDKKCYNKECDGYDDYRGHKAIMCRYIHKCKDYQPEPESEKPNGCIRDCMNYRLNKYDNDTCSGCLEYKNDIEPESENISEEGISHDKVYMIIRELTEDDNERLYFYKKLLKAGLISQPKKTALDKAREEYYKLKLLTDCEEGFKYQITDYIKALEQNNTEKEKVIESIELKNTALRSHINYIKELQEKEEIK